LSLNYLNNVHGDNAINTQASSPYFSGEGTEASPYIISSGSDLEQLASLVKRREYFI
jgi:hypothetical protein